VRKGTCTSTHVWHQLTCLILSRVDVFAVDDHPTCGSVDAVWGVVVSALAAGLLGGSAKVSSKDREGGDRSQTLVICVYVDPFWDDNEMPRVLRGLREHCGISEELKFKADGATLLNIYKDNALLFCIQCGISGF
jgi:hypothetical protein